MELVSLTTPTGLAILKQHNLKPLNLMRSIFCLLLFSLSQSVFAQKIETKDSLVNEICKSVSELEDMNDSTAFWETVAGHLSLYFSKMEPKTQEQAWLYITMRLQRNCKQYAAILRNLYPENNGDWKALDSMPPQKASKTECRQIFEYKTLAYLESNGDTVHLDLSKDYWIDRFKDGTYSKLSFRWLRECEFEIMFIESNNRIRKNLSKPGDKYRYTLVEKKEHYYEVVSEVVGSGSNELTGFKIYF